MPEKMLMPLVATLVLLAAQGAAGQDGGWCWGFTPCSAPCGQGTTTKTPLRCACPEPANGGRDCQPVPRDDLEEFQCNTYFYYWTTESWSECSNECGIGEMCREVQCRRCDGKVMSDQEALTFCPPDMKPRSCRGCRRLPKVWEAGEWGSCNATECQGLGVQKREVTCKPCSDEFKEEEYWECDTATAPSRERDCQTNTYQWEVVADECVEEGPRADGCRRGRLATRCKGCDGSVVGDWLCDEEARPERECTVQVFYWDIGGYGECSNPCGKGHREKDATCLAYCGEQPVSDAPCLGLPSPDLAREECEEYKGGYEWGAWEEGCVQPDRCAAGTQQRPCMRVCNNAVVAPGLCGRAEDATRRCREPTYRWGEWGGCKGPQCGQTGLQTRRCVRECDGSTAAPEECVRRGLGSEERQCEYLPSKWVTGEWSRCEAGCLQLGWQERSVTCAPACSTGKKHDACDADAKPEGGRECQGSWHEWRVDAGTCNPTGRRADGCQDGLVGTRCVHCGDRGTAVGDERCEGQTRPQQRCVVQAYAWDHHGFGRCTCGGQKVREPFCRLLCPQAGQSPAAAEGLCPQPGVGPIVAECTDYPGGHSWTEWGSCSKTGCEQGKQTRHCERVCSGLRANPSFCGSGSVERGCQVGHKWSGWSGCSAAATGRCEAQGSRTRRCLDCKGNTVSNSLCQGEAEQSCVHLFRRWSTGAWGKCNGDGCRATGQELRTVSCVPCSSSYPSSQYGANCPASSKPAASKSCTTEWWDWRVGTTCGNTRARSDKCLDGVRDTTCKRCDGASAPDSKCAGKPRPSVSCRVETYSWIWGTYLPCNAPRHCGTGKMISTQYCKSNCGGNVTASHCPGSAQTRSKPCTVYVNGYSWGGAWGPCTGGCRGRQGRSCYRRCDRKTVANSYCAGRQPTRSCVQDSYSWGAWSGCRWEGTCDGTRSRSCLSTCTGNTVRSTNCTGSSWEACHRSPGRGQNCILF